MRLLVQDGGLLPECPLCADGHDHAVGFVEDARVSLRCIRLDDVAIGWDPRCKRPDFKSNLGAQVVFGECSRVSDVGRLRIIRVNDTPDLRTRGKATPQFRYEGVGNVGHGPLDKTAC